MAAVNGTEKRAHAKVSISLENCILPPDKLLETPSVRDGLDKDVEHDLRIISCEYIQASGVLLKLPQVAMATGQVLFQRFYYSKSFVKHDAEVCAMACIFLAAKIEEAPRRIRDVINVFHFIKQRRNNRMTQPMEYMGSHYFNRKNQVVKAERRVLKELGFCVHVKHPHKIIITYLQILECETNQELAQMAWNYMNDSLRANVFVRFPPEAIACACIFLSARLLKICLPNNPPWYELFDADLRDLEEISRTILELYGRTKSNIDRLQKKVAVIQKQLEEKSKKTKESAEKDGKETPHTSPQSASQQGSRAGSRSISPHSKTSPSVGEEAKKKAPPKNEESKKTTESKDRQSRPTRRSRSPRRQHRPESKSRSASQSPSRSRSRSRSRSYSMSISPDSHNGGGSDSLSSDGESPNRRHPAHSPDRKSRSAQRRSRTKDIKTQDRKSKVIPNSYLPKRDKAWPGERKSKGIRDRSRSPRSRSRSRSRERSKRYNEKYGRDRNRDRDYHRDRNGVDLKSRDRDDSRDSRRYR